MSFYREIASAIKNVLAAVHEVSKNCQNVGNMQQYKQVRTKVNELN
jgi:hypothetical protein